MKKYFLFFFFLILINCAKSNTVYWCGNHACINKKEKESYFKKTMTVEIREFNKKLVKKNSEFEKLLKQAGTDKKEKLLNKKELKKQAKLDTKQGLEQEKELEKQAKIQEELKLEQEKDLEKQAKIQEELKLEQEKDLERQAKIQEELKLEQEKDLEKQAKIQEELKLEQEKELKREIDNVKNPPSKKPNIENQSDFDRLAEIIFNKNNSKSYPDINDMPQ